MPSTDPIPGYSEDDLDVVAAVESLAFNDRFDRLCQDKEHLILSESCYFCKNRLFLRDVQSSATVRNAFGEGDHIIDFLELEQTILADQHTASLSIRLDGTEYTINVINKAATITSVSLATMRKVTRQTDPGIIAEIFAGVILSTAEDPNAVRLRRPAIQIENAEKIDGFSRALSQLEGSYGSRVVSAFSQPGTRAMVAVVEETEDPGDQTITADLSIGYADELVGDIINANHVTAAILLPPVDEDTETRASIAHTDVALDDYIFSKQYGLLDDIRKKKIDKDANFEEWAAICKQFWSIVHPLLEKAI